MDDSDADRAVVQTKPPHDLASTPDNSGAVEAVMAVTPDQLFAGQTAAFFKTIMKLAKEADVAETRPELTESRPSENEPTSTGTGRFWRPAAAVGKRPRS